MRKKRYDCVSRYESIKKRVLRQYGTIHLCGNCIHTTKCERAMAQSVQGIERKSKLMKINAPFVTKFEVEEYVRSNSNGDGFIKVYECNKFEFGGVC